MNTTLLNSLLHQIKKNNWNNLKLSQVSGVNKTDISRILNNKKPLSLLNLDAFTRAFELPEDTFYSYYIKECFHENGYLSKSRGKDFLYKCAEKQYEEPLQKLLNTILQERSKPILTKNLNFVFSVAESLFLKGTEKQSLPLYEIIIESMPNHFSEQVAISYSRNFYLVKGTKEEQQALALVLKHIPYMPNEFQQLSYLWIAAVYQYREEWGQALHYAKILEKTAKEGTWYAEALLIQSFSLRRLGGTLNEVLELINRSALASDFHANFAVGNRLITYIEFGHLEYVDQFISWSERCDYVYLVIPYMLEGLVKSARLEDARNLLNRFQHIIKELPNQPHNYKSYLHFRHAHALYRCARNETNEGLHELLDVANKAFELGNLNRFKKCLQIYWEYRDHTNAEHEKKYLELLNLV
ncbi:hypothetical protein [Bacillus sp. AFS017336]|uniref:hypothetical protein n=1 Tax=Bacillus sp. AFS017336 TaxID=2033489 RepID=UPI000BEF9D1D|nr:hypothetical protein [Bacillus sp. AFS017336]PEK98870.1 hypothetical protein CN601_24905 [Bacillus sp. AFS017336]